MRAITSRAPIHGAWVPNAASAAMTRATTTHGEVPAVLLIGVPFMSAT